VDAQEQPKRKPLPATLRARYGVTIALCAVATLFFGMPQAGFALYLFAIPWLVYALHSAMVAFEDPSQRRVRAGRLLIWMIALGLVLGLHEYYKANARADAELAIMQVNMFRQRHGRFPDDAEQADLNLPGITPLRNARYFAYSGKHRILYDDPWQPFRVVFYDLDTCAWSDHIAG